MYSAKGINAQGWQLLALMAFGKGLANGLAR
jgi:hypothetical protein